jgi:branched-chain amino acid transport system ATP-binding protein
MSEKRKDTGVSSASSGLVLDNIRAGFGETVVLDGVSLRLAPKATLALLGRNGVGKSTLLGTIMGHTTLHGGTVRFEGRDISRLAPFRRNRLGLGWVPQEREIFRSLTVAENLDVAERRGVQRRWSAARVYDLFPRLAERRGHYGIQLSGGEQQMLAIGRALMSNPTLVLMDEPLEGLAPVIVDAVLAGIEKLRRDDDVAILLVEQHAKLALGVCPQAMVLDRGRVVYDGASAPLLADPNRLAALMGIEGRAQRDAP